MISEDEQEDTKYVGGGYPAIVYEPFGSAHGNRIILVKADDKFIGTLTHETLQNKWFISFLAQRGVHTHIPVASAEDGAHQLWHDFTGLVTLPEIKPPYKPLLPPEGEPDHYESIKQAAKKLVNYLSEVEDEEYLEPDPKDVGSSQPDVIIHALKKAGFDVTEATIVDNKLQIEFTWPSINAVDFVNGWKRAKEVLAPFINLRRDNYAVDKVNKGTREEKARAIIIKRVENDPTEWQVTPVMWQIPNNVFWNNIYFNGKKVGEVYLPAFSESGDISERLREELAELHSISPFYPQDWDIKGEYANGWAGNAWGSGPAVLWWRALRSRLSNPRANEHFFDKHLINP